IPAGWDLGRQRRPDAQVLSGAGFEPAGPRAFAVEHRWSLPELAGYIRSTSFLPAAVLGGQGAAFDAGLAAALAPLGDHGAFTADAQESPAVHLEFFAAAAESTG